MSYYHSSHANGEGLYFHPSQPPPHPPPPSSNDPYHFGPYSSNHQHSTGSGRPDYFYVNSGHVWQQHQQVKPGYNSRKDSTDSGISDYSSGWSSRKTSSTSNASHNSFCMEDLVLEDVTEEMDIPDDELCRQIVQQVEFYFSDANISKDKFLLKHVKRNKEGFVSIKLISSFKRVKHLTKDWRQVAYAVEAQSDKLEVNDQKTKVRRLEPLPDYDETTPSRTVVALNLPLERPTIESVAEIFTKCGEIVLVRILRPGNPIPADIKPFANKHVEMTEKVCALIEFECTEFAMKAVSELNSQDPEGMKVMELTTPKPVKKDEKKKGLKLHQPLPAAHGMTPPSRRVSHAGFGQEPVSTNTNGFGPKPRRISLQHNVRLSENQALMQPSPQQSLGHGHHQQQQLSPLNPNAPTFQMQQRRVSQMGRGSEPAESTSQCPWVMRKRSCSFNSQQNNCGLTLPPNVIRMPRGPEKGKTFIRKKAERSL